MNSMNNLQTILDKYNEQNAGRKMYREAFPEITNELAKELSLLKMSRGTRTVLAAAAAVLGKALHESLSDQEKLYASLMFRSCAAQLKFEKKEETTDDVD